MPLANAGFTTWICRLLPTAFGTRYKTRSVTPKKCKTKPPFVFFGPRSPLAEEALIRAAHLGWDAIPYQDVGQHFVRAGGGGWSWSLRDRTPVYIRLMPGAPPTQILRR